VKFLLCLGIVLPLLLSCSTSRNSTVREASGAGQEDGGYLKVFSATEPVITEAGVYQPHTFYEIRNDDGTLFDQVKNSLLGTNEAPVRISLPPGKYVIHAKSDMAGWVSIPVNIEQSLTSSVHIDGSWRMPDELESRARLICLPEGDVVGWYGDPVKER